MMPNPPSYTKPEIERRWLVQSSEVWNAQVIREREIEDRYIEGTRLRLRKVVEVGLEPVYKLGKKYESARLVLTTSCRLTLAPQNINYSQLCQQESHASADKAFMVERSTFTTRRSSVCRSSRLSSPARTRLIVTCHHAVLGKRLLTIPSTVAMLLRLPPNFSDQHKLLNHPRDGSEKRSLSLLERGKPRYQNHRGTQLGSCGMERNTKERPRLFRARHGAGERVV